MQSQITHSATHIHRMISNKYYPLLGTQGQAHMHGTVGHKHPHNNNQLTYNDIDTNKHTHNINLQSRNYPQVVRDRRLL